MAHERRPRQILFVQGAGAGTHDDWDKKLVENLRTHLDSSYEILYPRMPNEDNPTFVEWKTELESWFTQLRPSAILAGHSVGAAILLKMLATSPAYSTNADLMLLITPPFFGSGGWDGEDVSLPDDVGSLLPHNMAVHVFFGTGDDTVPSSHANLFAGAIPQASVHTLQGRDHQLNNDLKEVAATILSAK